MHWPGHVGLGVLAYLPLYLWLAAAESTTLAVIGLVVAVGASMLPDVDIELSIPHRGPTHTLWFVAIATVLATVVGYALGIWIGRPGATAALAIGGAMGLSLTSHVAVDALTPMGIRPLEPLSSASISLRVVKSRNRFANRFLFATGGLSILATIPLVI
ncbi:metal-dependent hydrolase [Halovivax limisalsi]|uniref:metal-dependent hydrolase n=1 Tax=Halovivax limisalsi TaxID=1453760 RepID=UPI001FFDBCC2|nr:metal-dependent hydrolase [Halovivax limisalsi]